MNLKNYFSQKHNKPSNTLQIQTFQPAPKSKKVLTQLKLPQQLQKIFSSQTKSPTHTILPSHLQKQFSRQLRRIDTIIEQNDKIDELLNYVNAMIIKVIQKQRIIQIDVAKLKRSVLLLEKVL